MRGDIREYARLGFVHHLLYPDCVNDEETHCSTLATFADWDCMETFDCCMPFGAEHRRCLAPRILNCGKEVVYALHVFPLRKISLGSLHATERGLARLVIRDQIQVAAEIGAKGFIFASGVDIPGAREQAREHFYDFSLWLCRELRPHGIQAMLEPFDREVDKKFLFGPLDECVELVERLRKTVDNVSIELDFAHVSLLGETFEQAARKAGPYMGRVHLGNCVLKDPSHPLFGDCHPPIGLPSGEIDCPELARILESLLSIGYLRKGRRGALVCEMIPFPGQTVEFTVTDNLHRLEKAWSMV